MSPNAAARILDGFRTYRRRFEHITAGADRRFRTADWAAVQAAGQTRLNLYKQHIDQVTEQLDTPVPAQWTQIKAAYAKRIAEAPDGDLAETFFNSVHRRCTHDGAVDDEQMFVATAFNQPPPPPAAPFVSSYRVQGDAKPVFARILRERAPEMPWQDIRQDVRNIAESLPEVRPEASSAKGLRIDLINALFHRNKGAYIVGRLRLCENIGTAAEPAPAWPIALPLAVNAQGRVYVDTLICDEDELSIVFSFTRAYFMVRAPYPFGLVQFLNELLPNKKRSELFAAIGLHKHGKTEFYRGFLRHLDESDDQFVTAPGIKGMVMTVFTLPSYQTVFKVIKDVFAPQKAITAADVRQKYHIVKRHDRAGRMADTQEFKNLRLPLARFSPELIDELLEAAPSAVRIEGRLVHIRHLYTERAMTPLNLHIQDPDAKNLAEALDEYGNAIKQLAAANIFPGDMLLKNFGVTRHGRVVFYDYDEICYLTDMNFRALPQPSTPEQEMAAEPWYSVAENDVFPEEFRRFLFGKPGAKQLFERMHGELFTPEYWRGVQRAILDGETMDVYPYRRKRRFARRRG